VAIESPGAAASARSFPGSPKCLPGMAFIAPGTFPIGSARKEPESFREQSHEYAERMEPAHKVKLDAYCIDIVQVTHSKYAKCVESGTCSSPKPQKTEPLKVENCNWDNPGFRESAVSCVTARQATEYCGWVGKRLPTEPEWEHAARGSDDRLYPWGDRPEADDYSDPDHAPICKTGKKFTDYCPVGSFPKGQSPFGLLDMVGSAADWTSSDLCTYPDHACKHPQSLRIARGGRKNGYFVTYRHDFDPVTADPFIGFRCAGAPLLPEQMR